MSSGGSPRQKMINMMYLVLIALLAMNVSKEILKAFSLIENSFESSKKNLDAKNSAAKKAIVKEAETNPSYQIWVTKADLAQKISADFCKKIEDIRKTLETDAKGRQEPKEGHKVVGLAELQMPDNLEIHANYFDDGPGKKAQGKVLQKLINDTRTQLLAVLKDEKISGNAEIIKKLDDATGLKAENPHGEGPEHDWVQTTLIHTPLAGVMTMLNKYMNDCKNLESDVLNEISAQVHAKEFKFDQLVAKLIPTKGTMILEGDQYEAEIILSAYNSQQNADMTVNGAKIPVEAGVGKYKATASEGERKIKAQIKVAEPGGGFKTYDVDGEYMGFKSSATISAEKMNVLYVGLDNPIKISVPGFPPENVVSTLAGGGSLVSAGSKGSYIATVPAGAKEVTITANVKTKTGTKPMGNVKFRVKNVPKPTAMFGVKAGGTIRPQEVTTTSFITCGLGQEFAFEGMNYTVTKFNLTYIPKKGDAGFFQGAGNSLNGQMKGALAKARKGDMITVYNIEAMGPGKIGLVKIPTAIALTVE